MTQSEIKPGPPGVPGPAPGGALPQAYGRFVLLNKLGEGGMGEAFRAVVLGPQKFQRVLVLKRILPHVCREPSFIQMFVDEANLSARLSHQNIVQIYEFGSVGDTYFIAMEYVAGRNLSHLLSYLARNDRTMPPALAAEIARQTCLALHYAHTLTTADGKSLGIVHRDVSPANVMVTGDGLVKVLDFGIARAAEGRETHTSAGTIKGKVDYLAPEQIQMAACDHRVDIFALGIVLHEMLTGQRLFRADTDMARMHLILDKPIAPPSQVISDIGPALDRIVMRALEREPERRYPTAADMASDLESFLNESHISARQLKRILTDAVAEPLAEVCSVDLTSEESEALDHVREGSKNRITLPGVARDGWEPAGETRATVVLAGGKTGSALPDPVAAAAPAVPVAPRRHLRVLGTVAAALVLAVGITWVVLGRVSAPPPAPPPRPMPTPVPATVVISFDSSPQEAHVIRADSGQDLGKTPVAVTVARGRDLVEFRLEREGYTPAQVKVLPDLDKPALVTLKELPAQKPVRPAVEKPAVRRTPAPQGPSRDSSYGADQVRRGVPVNPFGNWGAR